MAFLLKKLAVVLFLSSFLIVMPAQTKAGDCETTISSATTSQLNCADDDNLNVTSAGSISYNDHQAVDLEDESGVQITNDGTIETADGTSKNKVIHAVSSLNTTITNNKTINADNNSTIYLDYAENVTITNNSGATISAEGDRAIEGRNIGWCDKAGNNNDCQSSLSSSGSTEVGLTLYNHGTISSDKETIWMGSGSAGAPRSRGIKIYNYDGGIIKSTSDKDPIRALYLEDSEIINYEGGLIQSAGRYAINTEKGKDLTITNNGTIESTQNTIYCKTCTGVTFENTGTITSGNNTVLINRNNSTYVTEGWTANTITNSGTITADSNAAITISSSDGTTLTNTGTITGAGRGIHASQMDNSLTTNYGTISATSANGYGIWYENDGSSRVNNILNNFGTISATVGTTSDGIGLGKSAQGMFNTTINNSGTISGSDNSILVLNSSSTGIDVVTKGEGAYEGEIDLNSSATTMTLDCSISKDQDIELHGKTNMTITNNLCGNDRYEILDSSKILDADNSETNGYLRIYGEDLDVVSNNKKYRTEIFSNSIKNIFESLSDIKERSTFYTETKRNNIYKNSIKGVSGYFLKNDLEKEKTKTFLAYFEQNANFNSKEISKSENLAFGYDIKTNIDNFSIKQLFGISSNKITDIETETEQIKRNNFLGQFYGLNANYKINRKTKNNNDLSLTIIGEYGAHRLPKYVSNFTHGDLSVDEAIDQVLGVGFDVEYSIKNKNGFILKPYVGLAFNNTLSGKIKMNDINGSGLKDDISQDHNMNGAVAKKIGISLTKNTEDIGLNLNFEHSNQDNIDSNNLIFSVSKKIQRIAKRRKEEEKLNPDLEELFDQLQVVRENERLALVANKLNDENQVMKELIIKLIKENQKIKTENKLLIQNIKNSN